MSLPDVQALRSDHDYKLTRVGVTGVEKPVQIDRPGASQTHALHASFDLFVDLPAGQRGIHMSRNLEAIGEVLDETVREPRKGLEWVVEDTARELLDRHDYASVAEVEAESTFFVEQRTPSGAETMEPYELVAKARADREGELRRSIGVVVTGMTACPCAMETTQHILEDEQDATIENAPSVTHNQRNETLFMIDVREGNDVNAEDMVRLVEESMSAPTFELLKRGDEARLVLQAHESPRFVEDVVREVLSRARKAYDHLPDDTVLTVKSEAEESIHKHNAFAERVTTLGDLREEDPESVSSDR
jgi:GTP cyclohydrolase-4